MDTSPPSNAQGKSLDTYRAANQTLTPAEAAAKAEAARASAPQGKSIQGYRATGSSVTVKKPAVTPQGKSFQDYLATSQGNTPKAPAPSKADLSEGKTIDEYAAAAKASAPR